jgi:hypothetical protein
MAKLLVVLFMLLLLGCEEKQREQECDAICKIHRANFENITTGIVFSHNFSPKESEYVSVTKTVTGAIAKYKPWGNPNMEPLEAELSLKEWQDFIRALYKCRINEWKKYKSTGATFLEIYSSDRDYPYIKIPFSNLDEAYLFYQEFDKIIDDMKAKIEERAGSKER